MRSTILGLALMALSVPVFAAPITYTFEFNDVSLLIAGHHYDSVPLTIEVSTDTKDEFYLNGTPGITILPFSAGSAKLTVPGLGTGSFIDKGFLRASGSEVGVGLSIALLYIDCISLKGFDFNSDFGPVSGSPYNPNGWVEVLTTFGASSLDSVSGPVHFTSGQGSPKPPDPPEPPAVPEPATALLALPLLLAIYKLRGRSE